MMKLTIIRKLTLVSFAMLTLYSFTLWIVTAGGKNASDFQIAMGVISSSMLYTVLMHIGVRLIFKKPFSEISFHSNSVAQSTTKLVDASHQVSSASAQQAAAIQETVATVTQLNATIRKSVEIAERSFEVAENSQRAATEGQSTVNEMIQAIDEINMSNNSIMDDISHGNQRIADIAKVITEISNKTKVINDIVFQTKLLSFNASVEAARAGEHGKGFSVVAEEIGNLAEMSGKASKEIAQMLNTSIEKVNGIVDETSSKISVLVSTGKTKVDSGIEVARRCGEVLQQVVKNANQVNQMISEISLASKEQALGMGEIAKAMNQIDTVTQLNASTAQDTADYSAKIFKQTEALRMTLDNLQGGYATGAEIANLVSSKMKSPKTNNTNSKNVFTFKTRKKNRSPETVKTEHKTLKQAVGSNIPHEEDPDFEDV